MQDIEKHNLRQSSEWSQVKKWFAEYIEQINKISETTDAQMFEKRKVLISAIEEFIEDIEQSSNKA